jgi:hypothetical protein
VRLVKVKAPAGKASQIAEVAFAVGLSQVGVHKSEVLTANQPIRVEDVVEIEASTPKAKQFVDQLMVAPFFNVSDYAISVRQPRSIINHERFETLTLPLVEPSADICQELWQFSQITYGFIGRILIGAMLLAFGMIEYNLLFMIAGLLFIPLLPLMLAAGFGLSTRDFAWRDKVSSPL